GVPPGTWQIRVDEGFIVPLGATTIQVDDRDIDNVSVAVQAPQLLQARVRIEGSDEVPPAGIVFWLESPAGPGWEETTSTHRDGSFELENVPAGRYRVHVRGSYYVKRIRYGDIESTGAEFSLAAHAETLEVVLSGRGALLSGVVQGD